MRLVTRQLTEYVSILLAASFAVTLAFSPSSTRAQDTTFVVTVADKTEEHPFFQQGWDEGYLIDGVEGAELTLETGQTYLFIMENVPTIHPFYITESEIGGGAEEYESGVVNNFATGNDTLFFTPPEDAPELLYYQCDVHAQMGYRINIMMDTAVDTPTGLPEQFALRGNYPNPFNPSTTVRFDLPAPAVVHVEVFDLLGRRQLITPSRAFAAGGNQAISIEASGLASGTYVYRVTARTGEETRSGTGRMIVLK